METKTAYLAERAKGTPAAQAIRAARYAVKMAGLDCPRWAGDSVRIDLPRGEHIVCELQHDDDADICERLQCSADICSSARDAASEGAREGWISRDGRVLFDANGNSYGYAWAWWSDNYGFRQFWEDGRRQHGRHASWLRARRMVADGFDYYRQAQDAGYVGYSVTLFDAAGGEVDNESCWGFEAVGDYAGQEARSTADSMARQRARHWEAETAAARQRAADIRGQARALVADIRRLSGAGPAACAALRQALQGLRADHRQALAVIAGGAA